MSNDKQRTTSGFSGGILWEILLAFSSTVALITFIVILSIRLHTHAIWSQALLSAVENAIAGFGITTLALVLAAFGAVYISNYFEGKK